MFSLINKAIILMLFWFCTVSLSGTTNYYSHTNNHILSKRSERDIGLKVSQYLYLNYCNRMNSFEITSYDKNELKNFITNELRQSFYLYTGSLSQDGSGSEWINDFKDTLYYDIIYNNIRRWEHRWQNNEWNSNVNDLYEYDNNNFTSSYTRQIWDYSYWLNNENTLYGYDNLNRLSEELYRIWISGSWINKSRNVSDYNQNGYPSLLVYQIWQNNNWLDSLSIEYIYNSDNLISQELKQKFVNSSWVNESLIVYNYNSQLQVSQSIQKFWKNGEWFDSLRTNFIYNSSGYLVEQTEQIRENSNWVNSSKSVYTYNEYGYTTEAILKSWLFGTWINVLRIYLGYSSPEILDLILLQHWNFVGGWANLYRFLLFYEVVSVTDDQVHLGFSLSQNYPNPFNPSTKISWQVPVSSHQVIKIFDILGNEVVTLVNEYKSAGSHEVEWDANGFPSGVYFYQLRTENYVDTKKMILLR